MANDIRGPRAEFELPAGFKSIGFIGIGNNDDYEVLAPINQPADTNDFRINDFPVQLIEHQGDWEKPVSLADFLLGYAAHSPWHLNEIAMQLGELLTQYCKERDNVG